MYPDVSGRCETLGGVNSPAPTSPSPQGCPWWAPSAGTVTANLPLGEWVNPGQNVERVIESGIALADLQAWGFAALAVDPDPSPDFLGEMMALRAWWPDLLLRDAVGWMMSATTNLGVGAPWNREYVRRYVLPWAQAGMLADGWVYAAAGLTPGEETVLGPDQVRLMAALRGATYRSADMGDRPSFRPNRGAGDGCGALPVVGS